jgi:uncharacterized protein YkwD
MALFSLIESEAGLIDYNQRVLRHNNALILDAVLFGQTYAGGRSASGGKDKSRNPSGLLSGLEIEAIRAANEYRVMMGLRALFIHPALVKAAQAHSQDMAKKRYFSHISGNVSPFVRCQGAGYPLSGMGENIAMGQTIGRQVFDAWYS